MYRSYGASAVTISVTGTSAVITNVVSLLYNATALPYSRCVIYDILVGVSAAAAPMDQALSWAVCQTNTAAPTGSAITPAPTRLLSKHADQQGHHLAASGQRHCVHGDRELFPILLRVPSLGRTENPAGMAGFADRILRLLARQFISLARDIRACAERAAGCRSDAEHDYHHQPLCDVAE